MQFYLFVNYQRGRVGTGSSSAFQRALVDNLQMTGCARYQQLFTDWRKSAELQPAASQRRAAAAGQRRNAAAPRGGGRCCRQRLRSFSELLGRPRGAALSARPLRNQLRSGITKYGQRRHHLGVPRSLRIAMVLVGGLF